MGIEENIASIIEQALIELDRPDLYRAPLVAFSPADDERYSDLKRIVGAWVKTPREFLPSANTVISYFVPYTRAVAAAPRNDPQTSAVWGEAYVVINDFFAHANELVCAYLQDAGFEAASVPATHTYDPANMQSAWSHRSAAAISGLGYFSANRMLVSEKGSAGRYCTVFTSAVIDTRQEPPANRCPYLKDGSCRKCFDICPIGALTPDSFDKFACQDMLFKNQDELYDRAGIVEADVCGRCLSACPLAYFE